ADGVRAFAGAGRWNDAVAHAERHRGVGRRLLDGRQAAVSAHALAGESEAALSIPEQSTVTEAWEQAVEACLRMFCRRSADHTVSHVETAKVEEYLGLDAMPELVTFRTRVALTAIDLSDEDLPVRRVVNEALDVG